MEKVGESMLASLLTLSQASSPYFCCSLMFYINPNVLSRTLCLYLDVPREVFEDETVHGGPKLVSEERPRRGRYEDGGVAWWISRVTGQPRAMMHDDQIACGYMTSYRIDISYRI